MFGSVDLEMTVFALCIKDIEIALFMYFVECLSEFPWESWVCLPFVKRL